MARLIHPRKRTRRKKAGVPVLKSQYSEEMLFQAVEELQSGKIKLERMRYNDDVVPGLRFVMNRESGAVTFHIQYEVGKDRYYLLLGALNPERKDHITIKKARERAEAIKALAEKGVNVQDGLHERLMKEIDRDGTSWKPK